MYAPAHFAETRIELLHPLISSHPLASLVVVTPRGLEASHVPFVLQKGHTPLTLEGHIARANPLAQDLDQPCDALAIFHGPEAYISPSWYATKAEHGQVVPTWNYVAVHARGRLRRIEDPAWISRQLAELTQQSEAGSAAPWAVDDAPLDYRERLLGAIVGIELTVTALEGKWKLSQNQPPRNRYGVLQGLRQRNLGDDSAVACLIAAGIEDSETEGAAPVSAEPPPASVKTTP